MGVAVNQVLDKLVVTNHLVAWATVPLPDQRAVNKSVNGPAIPSYSSSHLMLCLRCSARVGQPHTGLCPCV